MPDQPYQSVLLFGAPGVGKGTQGRILGCIPGFRHLSTGDVFRALDQGSPLGKTFHQYSSKGELVPDKVTIEIFREYVAGLVERGEFDPRQEVLLLDGIPRNPAQANLLEPMINVLLVICLKADDREKMVDRLRKRAEREGRDDDAKEEVIRRRLEIYDRDTRPVLEHYDNRLIATVDAVGSPATVLRRVLERLAPVHERQMGNILEAK